VRTACLLVVALTAATASGCSRRGSTIRADGVSATIPSGWNARVKHGALEVATIALPPEEAWIGQTTAARLGRDDVLALLFEDPPEPAFSPGDYRPGAPRPFRLADFGAPPLGGSNPGGHRFAHRNFRIAGRSFSLFAESGGAAPDRRTLAQLNRLTGSIRVQGGDFYPGLLPPPTFAAARGWHAGSVRPVRQEVSNQSVAWAATVSYRDEPLQMPPHATLAHLGPDGIVISALVYRDDRSPPTSHAPRLKLSISSWHVGRLRGSDGRQDPVHGNRPGTQPLQRRAAPVLRPIEAHGGSARRRPDRTRSAQTPRLAYVAN
jgi:hypothetical protein